MNRKLKIHKGKLQSFISTINFTSWKQGRSNVKGQVGHVSTSFWVSKDNFSRILPQNQVEISDINTQYMRNPDIVYVLKIEYGWNLWLKVLFSIHHKKYFWNPSMQEDSYLYYWICDFGHFYEVRESSLPHGGISKIFF